VLSALTLQHCSAVPHTFPALCAITNRDNKDYSMASYRIGIDTGGTYTDGVLIDNNTLEVVHWAKEITSHHNLGIGVGRVLESLLSEGIAPEKISSLSVSTTLATNAIVEGRGARVGLFIFGYVRHFKLPVIANIFLKGGHKITGKEDEPLDIEGLVDSIKGLEKEVDSYAVCGAMSIKNPTHELVAEKAITMLDPKPVFCSHQVSDHPGMRARAATACLHARLMPLMTGFLNSIQHSMDKTGLTCPVTIICGNGKGAGLDEAVQRAAITMASGPAATARFGCTADEPTALVVDVGGTTTDVCMIRDGQPVLSEEGCLIGQWQTHVEAIDMYTAGGGGDSHVICASDSGTATVQLATSRVQPLAMTADLPDPTDWLGCGLRNALVLPVAGLDPAVIEQDELLAFLRDHGPVNPETLARKTSLSGVILEKQLERLVYRQQIKMAGFTPTDALHVLGILDIGNSQQAEAGAAALAAALDMPVTVLCQQVIVETEKTIEAIILDYLGNKIWTDKQATPFLNHRDNELFSIKFAVKIPIIGIGAAARCFLPGVAKRLQTRVSFPEHYEVGNAIGAALIGGRDNR
jgi:N-methylhydantoinase A/oxoprolinase/acetone carboxylase beta subunit